MGLSTAAPGPLETVRRFVNTWDMESGVDGIGTPDELRSWLAAQRLLDAATRVTSADVRRTALLREAIRSALAANHDDEPPPPVAVSVLNDTAARARLTPVLRADGRWVTEPRAAGVDEALGGLVAVVAGAMTDGTWPRLKVCVNDTCRWAFYDRSKSRAGKWCSMQICGNRAKQQAWRARQDEQDR